MNPDGTGGQQLIQDISVMQPLWSPDGKWIAFAGLAIYEAENPPWNLVLIDPAGGELKRLTFGPNLSAGETLCAWSPDGTQLIFIRSTPDYFHEVWSQSLIDGSERLLLSPIYIKEIGLVIGP
jgi:Tol biopolymer transport system component